MLRNRLYYGVKPLLPASIRMSIRRWFAVRKREQVLDKWPILPGSEKPPEGWPGWPDGKKFALVLTHDVEGPAGLAKCRKLMELEMRLGFRSCFNFIPEGDYRVPRDLLEELKSNGFEIGVHDLKHDGKLFSSRNVFRERAAGINHYLKEWGAVGFRSGFMLNNLNWLHDLDVTYDASTFDTDPFEPQPDGVNTIFPFWIPRNGNGKSEIGNRDSQAENQKSKIKNQKSEGYVELPYTLPQDSTLFLLLRERHPDIWFQKLDWIAKNGGMALLDVHPDYIRFDQEGASPRTFPAEFYIRLLEYVVQRYGGSFWRGLPRDAARLVGKPGSAARAPGDRSVAPSVRKVATKPKVWIDLDNTPHVPFFEPVISELTARGFPLLVTARDAFQVCDLADEKGLKYVKIGRHYGKNRLVKAGGLAYRSLQLARIVLRERPALGVSHGARSQLLLCNWFRIPTILIEDYEHALFPPMMRPTWVMAPSVIPDGALRAKNAEIRKYPGIKEDVYAWKLKPEMAPLIELGIGESDLLVTVRPPATEAHYHNPESERLFAAFMDRACQIPQVKIVLLPRNRKQSELIRAQAPRWFRAGKTVVPESALDGMNLIWHSDLVVSGGGTMNREAAALGVPVYSIFRGPIGAVDRHLADSGRLVMVESVQDVHDKINLVKRAKTSIAEATSRRTLQHIVDTIQQLAEQIDTDNQARHLPRAKTSSDTVG